MSPLFNYFVVTTWQFGKDQHAVIVRAPIGETWLESSDGQYWTGKRWHRREGFARKFPPNTRTSYRVMRRLARVSGSRS